MRVGEMRHRVALQAPTETRGAAGGVIKTFVTQDVVWGSIQSLSGKEFLSIQQTQNESTARIVIRYYAGLDETWRILDTGDSPNTVYSIHYVEEGNKRRRMFTLMCSKGVQTA